jgi:hypothetical protein
VNTSIQTSVSHAPHRKDHVFVIYNGIERILEVRPEERVNTLREDAIRVFGPLQNPHLLALFTTDGRELNDTETLAREGVRNGEKLLLRPSAVRGG